MTEVLVATYVGLQSFADDGKKEVAFDGRQVTSITTDAKDSCLVLVDGKEIWRRDKNRQWSLYCKTEEPLNSFAKMNNCILASVGDARLARVSENGACERLTGFDTVDGRVEWFGQGPPLHIRALTATADGAAIMAAVHVGGIPRSTDGGETWSPTVPIDFDIHEVKAHPTLPNIVAAASALGLCVSQDGGKNWDVLDQGPEDPHALAVAALDREMIFSVQDGPFADKAQIWRWNIGETGIEQVRGGLPDWLDGKVDTAHMAAANGKAAVVDGGGHLWLSDQGSAGWRLIAEDVPYVFGMLLL